MCVLLVSFIQAAVLCEQASEDQPQDWGAPELASHPQSAKKHIVNLGRVSFATHVTAVTW